MEGESGEGARGGERASLLGGGTANFRRRGLRELDAAIRQAFSIEFN